MEVIRLFEPSGKEGVLSGPEFFDRLEQARAQTDLPFSPERLAMVAGVGDTILKSGRSSVSPFVTHFAFWIRAGALQKLAQSFRGRLPSQTQARARGLVLHLPPQNVETVFLYSWVLSFLAGNANVVRLPREISGEMRRICDLFLTALENKNDQSQLFVHYASESDIGIGVSARSDARVVWGGDAKVRALAPIPLRNGGKAIWFGDRFSFSVMKGAALAALEGEPLDSLAERLFNDIFIFDQMACSSPHILYVVGSREEHSRAANEMLDRLAAIAERKGEPQATGHVIRKMVEAFSAAATGDAVSVNWKRHIVTSIVSALPDRREQRVGGGFLRVSFIPSLSLLPSLVREHDQTVTHFGFTNEEITTAANSLVGFGVSRWAPVGSALDFDFVWDGYDIPFELTRLVRVS